MTSDQVSSQESNNSQISTLQRIGFEPDPVGIPVAPTILAGPREIYKQSPDI